MYPNWIEKEAYGKIANLQEERLTDPNKIRERVWGIIKDTQLEAHYDDLVYLADLEGVIDGKD